MTTARRRRLAGSIVVIASAAACLVLSSAVPSLAVAPTAAFREVPTHRILDTREAPGAPLAGGATLDVTVPEAAGAVAVVVSVTATDPEAPGFLTLYETGTARPVVSTLNYRVGSIVSNQATVRVDAAGRFTVYAYATTHVVVDLVGTYQAAAASSDGRFQPVAPQRVLDTRTNGRRLPAGGSIVVQPGLPGAEAAVVTITVTGTSRAGFVTAHRADQPPPGTSTLNFEDAGTIRSVLATVALAPDGTFRIDATVAATDVVVDVLGSFTGAAAAPARSGLYVALDPTRQFDTRDGGLAPLAAGSSVTIREPDQPLAIVGNLTVTEGVHAGFVTAAPGATANLATSSVNTDAPDETIAAAVAVAHQPGAGVTFSTYAAQHVLFDLTGEYVTEDGTPSPGPAAVAVGPREAVAASPFAGLDAAGLVGAYPDASSTRAAVMTSDGTVHSFGQSAVDLPAASTVKALVLGCTLLGLQDRGLQQPDPATADLLQRMISISDNDAATTLIDALGGSAALRPCAHRFGAAITINPNGWGVTQISPESFVRILRNLLRPDSTVLASGWVAYARSLMQASNIAAGERWGVGAGRPAASAYWVKDGWWTTSPGDFRYPGNRINSVGMVETDHDWWILAIQGDQYTTEMRGVQITELIASTVNRNLAGG